MKKYDGYRGKHQETISNYLLYGGLLLIILAVAFYLFLPGANFLGLFFAGNGAVCLILFTLGCIPPYSWLGGFTDLLQKIITVLFILWFLSFAVCQFVLLCSSASSSDPEDADYLIVMGAGLNGSVPSLSLSSRLSVALEYLDENPEAIAIVTGGKGSGESITEAQAMFDYLTAKGVSHDRIIMEHKATSSIENLKFSFDIIDELWNTSAAPKITVLSNEFHLYRIKLIASKEKHSISVLSAPTPLLYLKFTYYIREYFSLLKVIFVYG